MATRPIAPVSTITERSPGWIYQRAHVEMAHWRAEPRPRRHCDLMFKSRLKSKEYCSMACHDAARRAPEIACGWCSEMFHPQDHSKKYCCHECAIKGIKRDRDAIQLPERMCPSCISIYRPRTERAIYCSTRCTRIMVNRANRVRQKQPAESNVIYLTAAILDRLLDSV